MIGTIRGVEIRHGDIIQFLSMGEWVDQARLYSKADFVIVYKSLKNPKYRIVRSGKVILTGGL